MTYLSNLLNNETYEKWKEIMKFEKKQNLLTLIVNIIINAIAMDFLPNSIICLFGAI